MMMPAIFERLRIGHQKLFQIKFHGGLFCKQYALPVISCSTSWGLLVIPVLFLLLGRYHETDMSTSQVLRFISIFKVLLFSIMGQHRVIITIRRKFIFRNKDPLSNEDASLALLLWCNIDFCISPHSFCSCFSNLLFQQITK
jgi:hypothetical protein